MTRDPRTRFTDTVDDYRRYRPGYPAALFDWILAETRLAPGDTVIDIGCGTGISSRALARRGLRVIGIDPNEAMLEAARATGGGPTYVCTDAETLDVPVEACDAIIGGQSFHWIDLDRARVAFRRRLRRPSEPRVVAFWNLRTTDTPFLTEYDALLRQWSPEYVHVGAESRAESLAQAVQAKKAKFANQQLLDREGLKGRTWSSSYVRNVVIDDLAFDRALDALFDRHAENERVTISYETLALIFAP